MGRGCFSQKVTSEYSLEEVKEPSIHNLEEVYHLQEVLKGAACVKALRWECASHVQGIVAEVE